MSQRRRRRRQWLAKAGVLNNRDLEKEVRRHAGRDSGGFATVTISMPVEVLAMWNDAYELIERMSGTELEKWQVLEPALAELLTTHMPSEPLGESFETDDENGLSPSVRNEVLERGGWECAFPACTMRKTLDVHHIEFRGRGGRDEPDNLVSLCRVHHDLVHRGICRISSDAGSGLKFERPGLESERERPEPAEDEPTTPPVSESVNGDDESWRDETVADIFDGPRTPDYEPPFENYNDFLNGWVEQRRARELGDRSQKRRARYRTGAHVCAESESASTTLVRADPSRDRGSPGKRVRSD